MTSINGAVRNPRTTDQIFPGPVPGGELLWSVGVGPVRQEPMFLGPIFKYITFRNPEWDYRTFDFDHDVKLTDKVARPILDAVNPDLSAFFSRGGKLLHYHGWSDPGISLLNSVEYFNDVLKTFGSCNVTDRYRLFMVPGMGHCRDGDGTDQFDTLAALERWREKGDAPDRITGSRVRDGKVDRTRPLCPYPQVAVYSGGGNTNEAASFVGRIP